MAIGSLRLSMKTLCAPSAARVAKPSASGVCGTSLPRILKAQASEEGSVSTAWVAPAFAMSAASRASFSLASSPAQPIGSICAGRNGASGRSAQSASIGLPRTGTSSAPLSLQRRAQGLHVAYRMQPGIEAEAEPLGRVFPKPFRRRIGDKAFDLKNLGIDLLARLQRVAAVHEKRARGWQGQARRRRTR